jgi:alanine dehydrogenase
VVARTATHAFVNAAIPYIFSIASQGAKEAAAADPALEKAITTYDGKLVHLKLLEEVADGLE